MSVKFDSKYAGYALVFVLLLVYGMIAANAGSYAALAFMLKTVAVIIFALAHLYAFELIKKGWSLLMK